MVTIKQYAGSRLYDPAAGRYVSFELLQAWAAQGVGFRVVDAGTGEDVTHTLAP